ncbi:MAG TPA: 8-amino-7-oxononanoate synthase [Microscillaceae bacterium]|nr:8-amino-7-oxononanoate synthase [Microscillaceae bacterium]
MNPEHLDTQFSKIYEVAQHAKNLGVAHLTSNEESYNGREITINQRKHVNFSSCSYLGLALDQRVIEGAIDGVKRFGTSFPTSRSFLTLGYLETLENKLEALFGHSCIVTTSTSLAHAAFLPLFINSKDVFIADHQVHTSVGVASEILRAKGCHRDIVRHNDVDKLEEKIITHSKSHRNIWFLADGIYSMYGDKAPLAELRRLLDTYENFHVYIDDAHGMSWTGSNGKGYVLSKAELHPRMVLSTSLGKAFGSIGGVLVCHNPALKHTIKACGSSFIFSSPVPPSVIGASIASADIHLSPEISALQAQLRDRINLFKNSALSVGLPILGAGDTPIFFIPSGTPQTCFELSQKMMEYGFYQSSAVFPSVPYNSAGIRLTLTNWLDLEDIEKVVKVLYEQREKVLNKEKISEQDIKKHFKGIDFNLTLA